MSVGFGGAVKLTGESQYRQALRNITQGLKEVDSELKVVTSQYDKNDKSQEALIAQSDALNKKLELQSQKVETLGANYEAMAQKAEENKAKHEKLKTELADATATLKQIEDESGKTSLAYKEQSKIVNDLSADYQKSQTAIDGQEQALSKAKTELNNATAAMNDTARAVEELNGEMGGTASAAGDLGDSVKTAGDDAKSGGDGFTVFKGVLSNLTTEIIKGAIDALKELGSAVIEAGEFMVSTATDAAHLADEINTMSSVTGVSAETLQELNYASELLDVSTDTVTGALTRLTRSMYNAQDGTGETAQAFESMGISITDEAGNLRDNEEVFWDMIDYLGTVESATERDGLAMQLLGRSAQELNPLIEAGSGAFADLAQEAHDVGYVMDGETLDAFQNLDDNMQRMSNGATAARNALGSVLLPALTQLSGEGTRLLNQFTTALQGTDGDLSQLGGVISGLMPDIISFIQDIGSQVGEILGVIIPQLVELIPPLVNQALPVLVSGLQGALNMILEILPSIIPTIARLIPQAVSVLLQQLPQLLSVGVSLILEIARGLTTALPQLLRQLPLVITEAALTLIAQLPEILTVGMDLIIALIEGLTEAMPQIIAFLPTIIETIMNTLLEPTNLNMIITTGLELIMALLQGVATALPLVAQNIPDVIVTAVGALVSNFPSILQVGKDLITTLMAGVSLMFSDLRAKAGEIFSKIHDKVAELPDELFSIGENLVRGLINGIDNMTDWAVNKITSFGSSILTGLQDFFGIASPSKLFENEVGRYLAQGIGAGFTDEMASVTDEMRGAIPTSFSIDDGASVSSVGAFDYYTLVDALKEALTGVVVEMDDVEMGQFVKKTVTAAIYT